MPNKGTFHRLPNSAFEPLRITAALQTPVISDAHLPIDAVLYYTAMRERYGCQEYTEAGQDHSVRVPGVQLPLRRVDGHGPDWYYAASFARWSGLAEGQDHWNKRVDESLCHLIDFGGRRGRIDIASAEYKSYHMPIYYRHALQVHWYAVGHAESIRSLLRFSGHLGKKTSQGWGSVLDWRVEPWPDDWSLRGASGELMRAIPSNEGVLTGFRPSYWLPKNQRRCLLPVA
jgi:CRISPR type IV-associated protein Csf3